MRIQYGGSMKPENARGLLSQPDVDGGLIGGASLKADGFLAIAGAPRTDEDRSMNAADSETTCSFLY